MVGLLDISDEGQTGTVTIRGQELTVHGLSARQIARLLKNFESIAQLMEGKPLTVVQVIEVAPDAISKVIAYGTGFDETKDAEKYLKAVEKADQFKGGEQIDVIMKIFDVTFGERLNPFVKQFLGRVNAAVDRAAGEVPAGSGKVLAMKSRKELRDSLKSDTTPEMFGDTRHAQSQRSQN